MLFRSMDEYGFDSNEIIRKYFDDVMRISEFYNLKILLKFKRGNYYRNPAQVDYVDKIAKELPEKLEIIDTQISPIKLIDKATLVVCKPYSTIGFISANHLRPTVQYNASSFKLLDNYHSKRLINLANGYSELETMCKKLIIQ